MKKTHKAQNAASRAARQTSADLLAQTEPLGQVISPESTCITSNTRIIAAAWNALDKSVQNRCLLLAHQVNAQEGRTGRKKLSGYMMYCRLCAVRLVCDIDLPTSVPSFEDVGSLPPVLMNATPAASAAPGDDPSLTLHSINYDGMIQCFACAPVLSDQSIRATVNWTYLGTTDGLTITGTDISGLYSGKMPLPPVNAKVCLKLVPVSTGGFRGAELLVMAVVTATAALSKAA